MRSVFGERLMTEEDLSDNEVLVAWTCIKPRIGLFRPYYAAYRH